jgi:hypothetical protein
VTRRYGSASKARSAIRGRGSSNSPLTRVKPDETLKVRYLQEPEDWEEAYYHYIDNVFIWCSRKKSCEGCSGGIKASKVVLANALDVKQNKVIIIQMPTTLADSVLRRYEKFGDTVMDRDYDLVREGSGQNDTRYSADYDPPKKRDLLRYETYDIAAMILAELGEDAEESEPEDEAPRSSKSSNNSSRRTSLHADEDEDEDEEEEEDDFEEEEEEDELADLDRSELKSRIKSLDPDYVVKKSFTDDDLRDTLRDLIADSDEDEDEEEEDEPEPPKKSASKKPVPKQTRRDDEDEFRPANKKPVLRRPR